MLASSILLVHIRPNDVNVLYRLLYLVYTPQTLVPEHVWIALDETLQTLLVLTMIQALS